MAQREEEINALNRVLHLLEENSIAYLASEERHFGNVVNRLYETVEHEIDSLRRTTA